MLYLEYIVNKISELNPVAGKKLKNNFLNFSDEHKNRAEDFFKDYQQYLSSLNKSLDYAIDCYLKLTGDMFYERIKFLESGNYSNRSYKDVDARIYSNPDIMDYHMHGLILGQFLWPDQYTRFKFFSDNLLKYIPVNKYLEAGGGHGLFVAEAVRLLGEETEFDVVDISASALNISKNLVRGGKVNFILKDIFEYSSSQKFDFITAGEIIEHLEHPADLLAKLKELLTDEGTIYLTTPVNAPMIDHIYLFNNINDIKSLIKSTGFEIVEDTHEYSDSMSEERAIKNKIALMYACFLKKI